MDYKCATFTLMELNLASSLTSTASRSCKAIFKGCQRRLLATPSMDEDLVCMHAYFCPLSSVNSIQGSISCIFILDENHYLEQITL
jgi:hypothetical protein